MGDETRATDAFNVDEVSKWSIDEVLMWCEKTLRIEGEEWEQLQGCLRDNNIDGTVLFELDLDDCKELTRDNSKLAVRLKLEINKLKSQKQTQEDEILGVLTQLYSTVSDKLQDFQSQYTRLRLDVLEVVKKDATPVYPQLQMNQQQQSQQHQPPQHDYFEGHKALTPGSPNTGTLRQVPNRSQSSGASQQTFGIGGLSTPGAQHPPSSGAGNEPLKHMRASKEDSCERILKSAMKRHNLSEQDWREYVLVICYGDQERILELDEKPVQIFKGLKQQGLHPAIMLRQRGDFEEVGGGLTPGGRL